MTKPMTNYIPKSGETAIWNAHNSEVALAFVGEHHFVGTNQNGSEVSGFVVDLRPLKTEEEEEREKLIKQATDLLFEGVDDGELVGYLIEHLATVLVDSGWHNGPKVKPLSKESFIGCINRIAYISDVYKKFLEDGHIIGVSDND